MLGSQHNTVDIKFFSPIQHLTKHKILQATARKCGHGSSKLPEFFPTLLCISVPMHSIHTLEATFAGQVHTESHHQQYS